MSSKYKFALTSINEGKINFNITSKKTGASWDGFIDTKETVFREDGVSPIISMQAKVNRPLDALPYKAGTLLKQRINSLVIRSIKYALHNQHNFNH